MAQFHVVVAYDSDKRTWEADPELLASPVFDGKTFRAPAPGEEEFFAMLTRVVERSLGDLPTP